MSLTRMPSGRRIGECPERTPGRQRAAVSALQDESYTMPHSGLVIIVFEATSPIAVLVQLLFGKSTAKMSSEDKVASELTLTHSLA